MSVIVISNTTLYNIMKEKMEQYFEVVDNWLEREKEKSTSFFNSYYESLAFLLQFKKQTSHKWPIPTYDNIGFAIRKAIDKLTNSPKPITHVIPYSIYIRKIEPLQQYFQNKELSQKFYNLFHVEDRDDYPLIDDYISDLRQKDILEYQFNYGHGETFRFREEVRESIEKKVSEKIAPKDYEKIKIFGRQSDEFKIRYDNG